MRLKIIVLLVAALSRVAVAVSFDDVAPKKMSYEQAYEYCANQKLRLPTIHEFADFAVSQGAVGILATDYPEQSAWDMRVTAEFERNYEKGYEQLVYRRSGNYLHVDFYFNSRDYRAPDASWSKTFWAEPKGFAFYGVEAQLLDSQDLDFPYAVRCARD